MNSVKALTRPMVRALPFLIVSGLLAGCMTPTPYAPRTDGQKTGYTDRALTQTRYRVTFTGNSVTPRETVETRNPRKRNSSESPTNRNTRPHFAA